MKKRFGKVFAFAMAAVLTFSISPVLKVEAKTVTLDTETVYMTSKDYGYYSFEVENIKKVSKMKSSNANVYKPYAYELNTSKRYEDYGVWKENKNNRYYLRISGDLKKAGTAKLSFNSGKDTYKKMIKVKNYVNPLKTLKISNVNKNKSIAGKFALSNSYKCTGSNAKSINVKAYAASGWTIESISISNMSYRYEVKGSTHYRYDDEGNQVYRYFKGGKSNCNVALNDYDFSKEVNVQIKLRNKSNKANLTVTATVNDED